MELAKQFYRMTPERKVYARLPWWKAAHQSPLHHFAVQPQRDEAAVRAALTLPWSTRPVEGHIQRLKLIKRQMYERKPSEVVLPDAYVRASQTRLATDSRVARGLIEPVLCTRDG